MGQNQKTSKQILVLDLDETLIHVSKDTTGAKFKIPVKLKDGKVVKVIFFFC